MKSSEMTRISTSFTHPSAVASDRGFSFHSVGRNQNTGLAKKLVQVFP